MKNISANLIVESIQKVTGKGPHQLHEPLFFGKEMSYLKNTINQNFVSSAGEYVNKFEKRLKNILKPNLLLQLLMEHKQFTFLLKHVVSKKMRKCWFPH